MMDIRTLEHIELSQLLEVFNASFADYFVQVQLTADQLKRKILNEGIDLQLSVGAFKNDQLVAFILHAYGLINDQKTVYNAGTGVIPIERGQSLSKKLYAFILPKLSKKGISRSVLEVISNNHKAIKVYQHTGFKISRELPCFKGQPPAISMNENIEIHQMNAFNWTEMKSFWDWTPSWQNSPATIEKSKPFNQSIALIKGGKMVGYAIYNSESGRVHQFAIRKDQRRQGFGTTLFAYIKQQVDRELSIINVDGRARETLDFIRAIGLKNHVTQFEMEL